MLKQRTRRIAMIGALSVLVLLAAAGCRLVGQGPLHISNDLSGIGRDNTTFAAYVAEAGDPFPPAGQLSLFVRGDDFGQPPSYGMNGYLYLVHTAAVCPQSEGAPEAFTLAQVTIAAIVTVTNGSVNQFALIPDTPANRSARWGLMDINDFPGFPGQHRLYRCGTVTWTP